MEDQGRYKEQFERMIRWYKRYDYIQRDRCRPYPDEINLEEVFHLSVDDIYAFFLNCYHLKDWIKNDDSLSQSVRDQVEGFINKNKCLQICADICNSTKHLKLNQAPRCVGGDLIESTLWIGARDGSKYIWVRSTILTDQGERNAFEIARECVNKWREFIDTYIGTTTDAQQDVNLQSN
jgi:hypothetical protein